MFNIGSFEVLLIFIIALLVLGPERLPGAVRTKPSLTSIGILYVTFSTSGVTTGVLGLCVMSICVLFLILFRSDFRYINLPFTIIFIC